MEYVTSTISKKSSVSKVETNYKGHVAISSPYLDAKKKVNNPYYNYLLQYIALYDSTRSKMAFYRLMMTYYRVISELKDENDIREFVDAVNELKSMGGVISMDDKMFVTNIDANIIKIAPRYVESYKEFYNNEVQSVKNKNNTRTDDDNSSSAVGSVDINNKSDSMARIMEASNGVDSNLTDTYVAHIPQNSSDNMVKHFRRIKLVLSFYDRDKQQEYINEFNREIRETIMAAKSNQDLSDLQDYMEDLASQGVAARELYSYYQGNLEALRGELSTLTQQETEEVVEFRKNYTRIINEFDDFDRAMKSGRYDSSQLDDLMQSFQMLSRNLEDLQSSMSKEEFEKLNEEMIQRRRYLNGVNDNMNALKRSMLL